MKNKEKEVIVIQERDHSDNEEMVIGVASDVKNAEIIIDDYYGKDSISEISKTIPDETMNNVEYVKTISVPDGPHGEVNTYTLILEWFTIDSTL